MIKWEELRLPPINLYNAPKITKRGKLMVSIDQDVLIDLLKQTYNAGWNDGYANVGSFEDYQESEGLEELIELLSN